MEIKHEEVKNSGHISDVAIRRPVFTTMVALALMVVGLVSFGRLGVDLFPDISFPVVVVTTTWPGAGPEEMETLVSRPLEDALASTNGVDKIRSVSRESVSVVVVQFKLETDVKMAAVDAREKVGLARRNLPRDVQEPLVTRVDFGAAPIMTYTLAGNLPPLQLRELAEDVIKPGLEAVDGVASVNVRGGQEREIQVNLNGPRIQALGMNPSTVAQLLSGEGLDMPAGRITANGEEISIRAKGQFNSLEELGNVVLPVPNRAPIKLKDVAEIKDGTKESRVRARVNGQPAVSFEVIKASGANTVAIAAQVAKKIEKLKTRLPDGVLIKNIVDTSTYIQENAHEVELAIFYGGLMAILVIFFFMLDWRSTLISALALPTSVMTTFAVMYAMGFTMNMMSLLGLSLAIGLLIDDAVVVRENIFRHMELGEDPILAASRGTKQIALAVMATTFTVVAVFVPVAFTTGIVGQFFRQFGLTVAAAVMVSLFIAFTLDPMLSARLVKKIAHDQHARDLQHPVKGPILRTLEAIDAFYRGILAWSLKHRVAVAATTTVVFFASLSLVSLMGTEFQPKPDRGEFQVLLEMPAGTSIDSMDEATRQAERKLGENQYIRSWYTVVGINDDPTRSSIRVQAVPKNERPVGLANIRDDVRDRLGTIPDLVFRMSEPTFVEGANESALNLVVQGDDMSVLLPLSQKILAIVQGTPGATDVDSSYEPGKPELQIRIDRARAGDLGVSMFQVASGLRASVEGDTNNKFRLGEKLYDIRVRLRDEDRNSAALLETLTFPSRLGRQVYLKEVADLVQASGPAVIEREQRRRSVTITGGLTGGRTLGEVVGEIQAQIDKMDLPEGYTAFFSGEAERMRDTMSSLGLALGLAIIFIYFVLASQFESFVHPLTIMFSLPLAVVGALFSLFVVGSPLGMPTFIGIILLMGLVTKNAILLVDYTNQLREEKGLPMIDALLEAGPTRLRPILMTSLAMVLGMLPTAISQGSGSEFRSPMAIAIIGGVVASTFLTLVVVPVVYTWADRFTLRGAQAAKEAKALRKGVVAPLPPSTATPEPSASPAFTALAVVITTAALLGSTSALAGTTPTSSTPPATPAAKTAPADATAPAKDTAAPAAARPAKAPEPAPTVPDELRPVPWGPEKSLTLDEAYGLMLKNNLDLAQARSRLEQMRINLSRAKVPLSPFLVAQGNYTRNSSEAKFSFAFINDAVAGAVEGAIQASMGYTDYQLYANGLQPYPLPETTPAPEDDGSSSEDTSSDEIVIQPYNSVSATAVANWNILNARNFTAIKQVKLGVAAMEDATLWQTREMLYAVTSLYTGLYTLQQVVDVMARSLDSKTHHLQLTKARYAAGQVAQSDVLRADVDVVKARQQLRDSLQSVHTTAAELAMLLGLEGVELKAVPTTQLGVPQGDLNELVKQALDGRPDVKAARRQLSAAQTGVLDAKLDFMPTVGIQGLWRWSNAAGFTGENAAWSVGATATLPIWDGGLRLANLRDNRQKLHQAELSLQKLEMAVRKEAQVAWSNLEQARISLEASQRELELARSTYQQMNALFEAGRITALELRDAEMLVVSAELGKVRAEISQTLAIVAVNRALGTFAPERAH